MSGSVLSLANLNKAANADCEMYGKDAFSATTPSRRDRLLEGAAMHNSNKITKTKLDTLGPTH
jgi:hypothetical protein